MPDVVKVIFASWPDEGRLVGEIWMDDRYLADVRSRGERLVVSLLSTEPDDGVPIDGFIDALRKARDRLSDPG